MCQIKRKIVTIIATTRCGCHGGGASPHTRAFVNIDTKKTHIAAGT